jgi:hypothetical protein
MTGVDRPWEGKMNIDLKMDKSNLYREESYTDLKIGAVRKLVPVKEDGTDDAARSPLFMGQTQLMSPNGPLPVSCMIEAKNLSEAIDLFPAEVNAEVERIMAMAKQAQEKDASRIILPGQGR